MTGNGWTVYGNYGPYRIPETDPIAHIDKLIARLAKGHPDIDLLLDARNDIAQELAA